MSGREWTPAEDALLGSAEDGAVARMIARSTSSVGARRRTLGIPAYVRPWLPEHDALLGTMPDYAVMARTGRSANQVAKRRRVLGVKAWKKD